MGIALLFSLSIALQAPAATPVELHPNDLLRLAVANEKPLAADNYYAWMDRLQKPRGIMTKLMVATPQGILSRALAINDKPLSPDDRKEDDSRINRLLDPDKMRDKARKQHEDQLHIERLLRALPDAFLCEYATPPDQHTLRLECSPNPAFSPPNYESQVLQGMKTVILIDREDRRISRIEGTLFKDVTFGWGFLGRLNRGGHIEIIQSRIAPKYWAITSMKLTFDGRVVFIKSLHIEETETCWDYRSVPAMNVQQALDYLRAAPTKTH